MFQAGKRIKVLFICTGNSCRSQIAEGWARELKGDAMEAFSAGVNPVVLSERAVKVMAEAGVDISGQFAKHVDELAGVDFDYVVTVCDNAREQCPVFPGKTKVIHRSFEDPSLACGSKEKIVAAFRKTRDEIKPFIEALPEALEDQEAQ